MIKFFRKIRQKLLTENKFSKYVLYAIGEITLVIIGILLALAINNRSQERKHEAKIAALFEEILIDLEDDIEQASENAKWAFKTDSLIRLVINDNVTREDYSLDMDYRYIMIRSKKMDFSDNAYKNLTNYIDNIPLRFKPLMKNLNDLYLDKQPNLNEKDEVIESLTHDYVKYLSENKSWFSEIYSFAPSEEYLNYVLNDISYKNRILRYKMYSSDQRRALTRYENMAFRCYIAIYKVMRIDQALPEFVRNYMIYLPKNTLEKYEGDYLSVAQNGVQTTIEIRVEDDFLQLSYAIDKSKNLTPEMIVFYKNTEIDLFPKTQEVFFNVISDSFGNIIFEIDDKGNIVSLKKSRDESVYIKL